ncbi:MAG: UDP-3-O-acyl-N-acetylglucosamine deacetylase [Candidatus Midichloria mitochondrii]|nr:UDP-3-O-acyl-N-acetylglucosamine deacetylase [Candidatus Midichloria mitochondrii]MDJ1256258.1 UDP-3-O-acyl-N-acetylglucosamine deacetylase [Candidatus Midichloria mitochondrii]MDJ1298800.1 UDP-3-O-acyl-N-acetylglucosamine deacetylase [Candidatus Midichloria mitochondrii]MDJ1313006.1 UDP-3-O-acyl-N-acetylglucosamine deacetylase [Candidatus Midichloria mitochondrii]MDJ1583561.1 UDP-3-O-acyl-N-acetylglucosamine deacetylase [Candidatus Midichloria mitochondrii]
MNLQKTLANKVKCSGIGVHSGILVNMLICPAEANHGIVFVRSDLRENNKIPALFDRVIDTSMCTKIANEYGASVSTIEHLMSALWGSGIDNAIIYVDGAEVPVMDGSSDCFINLIKQSGIVSQSEQRKFIEISKSVKIEMNDKSIVAEPDDSFSVNFIIDFDNQYIQAQSYNFNANDDFESEIGKARTFGFIKDVEYLKSIGLAKGASLDNAIAIGEDGILNKEGLRYKNEFVRHKILDCIGDLYLAGARIKGKIKAVKSGHQLNNLLLHKIFETKSASISSAA